MSQKTCPLVFKYVLFSMTTNKEETHGKLIPIIFPEHIMHSDMDDAMTAYAVQSGSRDNEYYKRMTPVSAGFIDLLTLSCFGESESLELRSREDMDSEIIREYMKHGGRPECTNS